MEKELKELIRKNENELIQWKQIRDDLRDKIKFCHKHKFEEEVRIAQSELKHFQGVVYDYDRFIKDLKIILKSYENVSKKSESQSCI